MAGGKLDLSTARDYWAIKRPSLLAQLDNMTDAETWSVKEIENPTQVSGVLQEIMDILDELTRIGDVRQTGISEDAVQFNRIMGALGTTDAMYLLMHAHENYSEVSTILVRACHDECDYDPSCNVMWQRIMMLTRYALLSEITRDISEGAI